MFIKPLMSKALATFSVYSSIFAITFAERLKGGNTALESPEWIPAGSICSIKPMI